MLGEELQMPWTPDEKANIINKTYHYLISMEGTPATGSNTLLQKDDFATMLGLTVKEKGEDEKYDTDVKIAMAVEFDDRSDLKLYVTADGEKVEEYRLTGALQEGEKQAVKNPDGSYTLSGLRLKKGANFKVNLKGVQNLQDGIYIFSCNQGPNGSPAQTFVGTGESKQDVDLNVDLQFAVQEKVTYVAAKSESESETLEWEANYSTYEEVTPYDDTEDTEQPKDELDTPEEGPKDIEETEDVPEEKTKSEEKAERTTVAKKADKAPETGDDRFVLQGYLLLGLVASLFAAVLFAKKEHTLG
ncbi:MAG: hypothetical protein PT957_00620 [Firmicutes bacterium]|nr:hypothetical protein [Bacillota bacterium]